MFLAKHLFVQRPTKTVVLLVIFKITILGTVATMLAEAAVALTVQEETPQRKTVHHMLVEMAVEAAVHMVFVAVTAAEVREHRAMVLQVDSL
jgi:hypothetical protein